MANLSSEKAEKLLSHPVTPVSSIHTECVNVNEKFISFLVSSKTRDTLVTFETSSFVIRFFQFFLRTKMDISKIERRIKLKNEPGFF
jgi:hypothetical protein